MYLKVPMYLRAPCIVYKGPHVFKDAHVLYLKVPMHLRAPCIVDEGPHVFKDAHIFRGSDDSPEVVLLAVILISFDTAVWRQVFFQCRLSYGVHTAPVCSGIHQLCAC